jgi:lantibiotic biosynthesis protein
MGHPARSSTARLELPLAYESSGFFVARSALLPFSELVAWNQGLEPTETEAAECCIHARAELVARLRVAFARGELREAIFFASPDLERGLESWLSGGSAEPKLDRTFARYFQRMAGRATPFGLFAGVSLGVTAGLQKLELGPRAGYRRHTRLGMGYLVRVLTEAAGRRTVREQLRFEPNSTLYRASGRVRFATLDSIQRLEKAESYPVVDVEPSPHLELALARAASGATLEELGDALESPELTRTEIDEFVLALVDNQLLVPAWLPAVTGPEPFAAAVASMSEHGELAPEARLLGSACERLAELDRTGIGQSVGAYRSLAEELRGLPSSVEPSELLQTDLVKPGTGLVLGEALTSQLLRAAELIQRTAESPRDPRLDDFVERFAARYEARWVPLVEALDADLGIGFEPFHDAAGANLLEDLPRRAARPALHPFTARDELLQKILTHALQSGGLVYELDRATLELFAKRGAEPLPESLAVAVKLARAADGKLRLIQPSVIAPSAAVTLARFCHANPELEHALKTHVELEQARAGDVLLADVVHLPNGHLANFLLRPVLRSHEIVYSGKSGAPEARQLPVTDLYVSVEGGRVVLCSKRLAKRVSIRIANAHNFGAGSNLPIYRFLGALQGAERGGLAWGWSWGLLESSPFLPRLVHEDVILSAARWTLWGHELKAIVKAEGSRAFALIQELRSCRGLPRWLTLGEADQQLVVDLDNVLSVEVFVHEVRDHVRVVLEELLPVPAELAVHGPEGGFVAELLVPFVRREVVQLPAEPTARPLPAALGDVPAERSFGPCSEWLYAKLYVGRAQQEQVLFEIERSVVRPCMGSAVRKWFFVPYADPHPHLRLRFQGAPHVLLQTVLPALQQCIAPMLEAGVVWRFQLDTYERELERYGGPAGMALAEELFWADSEAACSIVALSSGDDELRWQLTLLGIDRLLGDLGFDLGERTALARTAADDYGAEFGATTATWKKIGDKYRPLAARLTELLWPREHTVDGPLAVAAAALRARSDKLASVRVGLERLVRAGSLPVERSALARSFAHMHAIRVLGLAARPFELVIYDFLRRQYAARVALTAATLPGTDGILEEAPLRGLASGPP